MKAFKDIRGLLDADRLSSSQQNLAHAHAAVQEGIRYHEKCIENLRVLRAEIEAAGDDPEACRNHDLVKGLYDRARKEGQPV